VNKARSRKCDYGIEAAPTRPHAVERDRIGRAVKPLTLITDY